MPISAACVSTGIRKTILTWYYSKKIMTNDLNFKKFNVQHSFNFWQEKLKKIDVPRSLSDYVLLNGEIFNSM